jgi:hypothetical protein
MVSAHGGQSEGLEDFKGLSWPQGTSDAIAEINSEIDRAFLDVVEHSLQGKKVPVNV